jgi:iron-sulfur cluster repair protein YtfE (RIC family)
MTNVPIHDAAALTHHIETRYHARHREQLPMLAAMAERVEDVHFGDDGVSHEERGIDPLSSHPSRRDAGD